MKPVSYRLSLLVGCAAFALCQASYSAQAALVGQATPPSIEIHLDVLGSMAPKAAAPVTKADASAKPAAVAKAEPAHKATKKIAAAKPAHKVAKKAVKEPVVASAEEAVPQPEMKIAVAGTETKAVASDPVPAPAAAAIAADVPKLPEVELKTTTAEPKKKTVLSGISGGFSDFLSSDSGKKSAKTEAAAKPPASPAVPDAHSAPTALAVPPDLAVPPVSVSTPPALSADKDIPSAPPSLAAGSEKKGGDNAPPLLTLKGDNESIGKETPKNIVVASNDSAPSAMPPRLEASDTGKAELPSLPAPDSASRPPELMAQSTLTPLPSTAPAVAVKPAVPTAPVATPPMSVPAVAPVAAVAPSPAPAAAVTPALPVAGAPTLRIEFNENSTDMPLTSAGPLDVLAKNLVENPKARVTILAYASGPETSGIYPKRVSLARGISIRNYLTTNKGIDIERVNVKALGNKNEGGPGDRVDLYVEK